MKARNKNTLIVAASVPVALAILLALVLMGVFTPASLGTFGGEDTHDTHEDGIIKHTHEHIHHVHKNPNAAANHGHKLHSHLHEADLHHGEETL